MLKLNLPNYNFRVKVDGESYFIFDVVRKRYVALTPEEWVRQNFIRFLMEERAYPLSLMAVERGFRVASSKKMFRCDIVCFNKKLQPNVIVECKSPSVKIDEKSFQQVTEYCFELKCKYMVLTNGLEHFYCYLDYDNRKYLFVKELPLYAAKDKA